MKICNNCSSVNTMDAVKCIHCNMTGNFTVQEHDLPAESTRDEEDPAVQCLNCGTYDVGHGDTCAQCRFPLPQQKKHPSDAPASRAAIQRKLGL